MKSTILLADDNQHFRFSMELELMAGGFKVLVAENGREALDMILELNDSHEKPDMLITDIVMPAMNGLELAQSARAIDSDLPILVTTSYLDMDKQRILTRLGCTHIMEKPFTARELMENLLSLMERCGKQGALRKPGGDQSSQQQGEPAMPVAGAGKK